MIKNFTLSLLITFLMISESQSQIVIGKLIDESGYPVSGALLELYSAPYMFSDISDSLGHFSILVLGVTAVEDGQLPTGYAVSNNFPNPFNPTTRIAVSLPAQSNVKVEVFNMLGESVIPKIEDTFNAGITSIDLELNGLSNGIYFSRVTIDDKHVAVRKMVLIYGSQHLNVNGALGQLNKPADPLALVDLDSLVVITPSVRKTFANLPPLTSDTLDLGLLLIESYVCPPTVLYEGRVYNTVQIGEQCWLKENLNVGTMILGSQEMNDNGIIEKYCYGNDSANCESWGALYQFRETLLYNIQPGARGICPIGWHIPTREEYEVLITTVGFDGNALKKAGQGTGNGTGTNLSGFSAILGGRRYANGTFGSSGGLGAYWTSTDYGDFYSIYFHLYASGSIAGVPDLSRFYGYCVRCIKDSD